MGTIVYGTRVFSSARGFFGPKEQCGHCGKVYSKSLVRYKKWAHLEYIPLFPVGTKYANLCPVCGYGYDVDKATAKNILASQPVTDQNIQIFAKHILANKPKGIMKNDTSYELWAKDLLTNEETCVAANIDKGQIKSEKKERGLKDIPIYEIK